VTADLAASSATGTSLVRASGESPVQTESKPARSARSAVAWCRPGHRGLPGRQQDADPGRVLGRSGGLGALCTHTPMLTAAHAGVDYL